MPMTGAPAHLDALRARLGGALGARLAEHGQRLAWDPARLRVHQRERLRTLLAHAKTHSRFHGRRLRGVDLERDDIAQLLRELPVMTKADMMAHLDDIVTDPRLTSAEVEDQLAASMRVPGLLLGEYVCLASGGSSGHRAIFVQRLSEYADFVASLMRVPMARLTAAGGPPAAGLQIALVAAASPVHSSGFGAATTGSGPIRLRAAPATLPLVELVARLNALQAPALMGYPTKLAQLAAEQRAGRLHIRPRMVTTTSELLTAEDRAAITTAFGAAVVDQFASTEGLVAHSEPGATLLTFATDMCLVEPVDETNRPVPPGEPAAKMLVTNLHNLTQPLIRYELTDRIVVDPHSDTAFMRASVDGRTDDVFRYGSVVIHPIAVRTVLVNTPAVTDYQARQTTSGVDLDIVTDRPVNARTLAQALERSLRNAGLPAAVVTVQTVPTIQRHPASGKGRRFVPLPAEQS